MLLNKDNAKYAVVQWSFWNGGVKSFHNSLNQAIKKAQSYNNNPNANGYEVFRKYENQPIVGVVHICNRGGFVFYEPLEDDKPDNFETYYMVGISWMDEPISDIQLCKVEYELVEDDCDKPIDLRTYVDYGDNRIYLGVMNYVKHQKQVFLRQ